MANPFSLIVAGVDSGANLLDLPDPSALTTPYVDLGSVSLTLSGDGNGGSMSFDVIETKTPVGGPWWRSGEVYDNARVQFFDSRYSVTTPLFLGYITGIDARMLENGLGSRATVSVEDADGWLSKTIIRNGKSGIRATSFVDSFTLGTSTSTDRDIINGLLARVHTQVNDATTRQILDTSVISGATRAIYTGTAQTVGKMTFKATTLQSALDQVAEESGGVADVQYRYFVDGAGRLNYGPKTAAPTYATAPAEIVTDPASVQTGSTSTQTRQLVRDLAVNLDHSDIVKGIFVQADSTYARYDSNQTFPTAPTNDPYFRTYTGTFSRDGAGLAARNGPLPQEVFSAPKIVKKSDRGAIIGQLARATMTTRGKPVRTVAFRVCGSDLAQTSSPDFEYGLTQGFALDAAISLAARSGTTATITTSSAHSVAVGDSVTIALSSGPSGFAALDGTYSVVSVPSTTTFTYTTATSGTITSGAAVGTINRLVKAWLPAQYVKLTAPALDLSAAILYIASVTMTFAQGGGSYQVEYDIQADFRRQYLKGLRGLIGGE
jgi:hypothetical protein